MNNKYNYMEWRLDDSLLMTHQTMSNSIFNNKLIVETICTANTVPRQIDYFVNGKIWFRIYTGPVLICVKMPTLIKRKDTCHNTLLKLRILDMVR